VVRKLVSTGSHLHFVYEAGPCGYQIYRHLTSQGLECDVVAPSRIPKPSGSQIKNDRRDALMLARLHRAGELTAVYVPRAEDEAIRDLTRAREDAKGDEKRSKQRLLSFLLRSGIRYTGGSPWSKAHVENQRQVLFFGDFQLINEPAFLVLLGRVHAIEIQTDLSPGHHFRILSQGGEMRQGLRRAGPGIMGMYSHRCKNVRMDIRQCHGPVRGAPVDADHQHPMDPCGGGTLQHILKIRFKGSIIQVAMTVK
jgi:hypothetical protein